MNRESLDRWCERGILALILAILVFGPLAYGAVEMLPFLIIQGLTAGVLALWTARLWLSPRPQFLWPPICWAVLAFTLYAIVRYFTADIEYVARQELIRVAVYACLFFAIVNNLHRQEHMQIAVLTLVFLAMAISGYAIYQFLTNSDRVWFAIKSSYPHRGSGTYMNPNHLGGFLEMLVPLGLAYALASRLNHVTKIFVGYASLVILAGIAVTVSRGSWISTILALLLFFVILSMQRTHRLAAFLALFLIIGGAAFLVPKSEFFHKRTRQLVGPGGEVNDDMRFVIWDSAIQIWRENPWWGAGPAHYDRRFRHFRPEMVQLQPERTHNDFLNTLTDWGIVGAALVASALALLGNGIKRTWPAIRVTQRDIGEKKRSNKFAFVLGASIGLLAIFLHSFVDFNMHIPANAIVAVTLVALLSSHLRFASDRYWITANPWLKSLASLILVGGLGYLGQQDWHLGSEYVWLDRAEQASPYSPEQVALLTKAFEIEPKNPDTAFKIGEAYRMQSKEGGMRYEGKEFEGLTYRDLAMRAMEWYARSSKLDPWNPYNFGNYGWCLDWLGKQSESAPYFDKANQLDPNGYFTMALIGMHYFETGNLAAARPWFERSIHLQWIDNPISRTYLQLADQKLMEAATNDFAARLNSARQ